MKRTIISLTAGLILLLMTAILNAGMYPSGYFLWARGEFEIPDEIKRITKTSELKPFLEGKDTLKRAAAIRRLGEIGGNKAISSLKGYVTKAAPGTVGNDAAVPIEKLESVRTLGRIGTEQAKTALLDVLKLYWKKGPNVNQYKGDKKYYHFDNDFSYTAPELLKTLYKWSADDDVFKFATTIAKSEDAKIYVGRSIDVLSNNMIIHIGQDGILQRAWEIYLNGEMLRKGIAKEKDATIYLLKLQRDLQRDKNSVENGQFISQAARGIMVEKISENIITSLIDEFNKEKDKETRYNGYTEHYIEIKDQIDDLNYYLNIKKVAKEKFSANLNAENVSSKFIRQAIGKQLDKDTNSLTDDDYKKVENLELHDMAISNIKMLERLTNLKSLNLSDTKVSNIETILTLTNLQTLTLSDTQVKNIELLSKLTNLETLGLYNMQVSDYSVLTKLTTLKTLKFGSINNDAINKNVIKDILPNLTNLQALYLQRTLIDNIEPLANLTNLQELSLIVPQVSDIRPLSNLTNLQTLELDNSQVNDISVLVKFTNLKTLKFYGAKKIGDIWPLANLTNMQTLHLTDTIVSDIQPLSNLTNLQSLVLGQSPVSDISVLAKLTNLRLLSLSGLEVNDIKPLSNLTNLQELTVSGLPVSDIKPLSILTNLHKLYLSGPNLNSIEPLANLINLNELYIYNTPIRDIRALGRLINLQTLSLSSTQVTNIMILKQLTNLKKLVLFKTKISDEQIAELKKALPNLTIN